ncbi:deoxynucleoside kinase [Candidatus Woesearchaeota archaeon]|nr:deoxynucleoside kinase [Candidatus Woesearchaeota archaeon]
MAKFVILVEGTICAGKTEFVRYLEQNKDAFQPFLTDGEPVVTIPEFIDHQALELFCHDMRRYANIFEKSCLTGRQVRQMKAKEGEGIYVFDRGMIGGAETFAKNSFQDGFFTHAAYQGYLTDLKDSLDQLDRTQQQSWLEQLIVYLRVADIHVLQERQRQRNTKGEVYSEGYLERVNQLYEEYISNADSVYANYGVRAPRVLTIDASLDFRRYPQYHESIIEQIIENMKEMNIHGR